MTETVVVVSGWELDRGLTRTVAVIVRVVPGAQIPVSEADSLDTRGYDESSAGRELRAERVAVTVAG